MPVSGPAMYWPKSITRKPCRTGAIPVTPVAGWTRDQSAASRRSPSANASQSGVQDVAQPVTQKVAHQDKERERDARRDRPPRIDANELEALLDHDTPRRLRRP